MSSGNNSNIKSKKAEWEECNLKRENLAKNLVELSSAESNGSNQMYIDLLLGRITGSAELESIRENYENVKKECEELSNQMREELREKKQNPTNGGTRRKASKKSRRMRRTRRRI